jgi:hypothetical protein
MTTNWHTALLKVQTEALETFAKKNQDYGNAFERHGLIGVVMRSGDKLARLEQITSRGNHLVEDESLRDTLMDLHNYTGLAVAMIDNENVKIDDENKNEDKICEFADITRNLSDAMEKTHISEDEDIGESKSLCDVETGEFESDSSPGTLYYTERTGDIYTCSCLGYKYRSWCKHCEMMNRSHKPVLVKESQHRKRMRL